MPKRRILGIIIESLFEIHIDNYPDTIAEFIELHYLSIGTIFD